MLPLACLRQPNLLSHSLPSRLWLRCQPLSAAALAVSTQPAQSTLEGTGKWRPRTPWQLPPLLHCLYNQSHPRHPCRWRLQRRAPGRGRNPSSPVSRRLRGHSMTTNIAPLLTASLYKERVWNRMLKKCPLKIESLPRKTTQTSACQSLLL